MKRLLVVLLLFATSAFGNSYLDSRADYYVAARQKLGFPVASSGGLTDTLASAFFSEAVTAILPINKGIKRLTTFTMSSGEDTYAYDSTLIGILNVRWVKRDSSKVLHYMPMRLWGEQEHKSTIGQKRFLLRPSFYDYTDSLILLHPSPTKSGAFDTIEIMGFHRLPDADSDATPTEIQEKYRISILYHIVYNVAQSGQHPMTQLYREELNMQLKRIGLSLTPGGSVVPSGN